MTNIRKVMLRIRRQKTKKNAPWQNQRNFTSEASQSTQEADTGLAGVRSEAQADSRLELYKQWLEVSSTHVYQHHVHALLCLECYFPPYWLK